MKEQGFYGFYLPSGGVVVVDIIAIFNYAWKDFEQCREEFPSIPFVWYLKREFLFCVLHELGHAYEDLYLKRECSEEFAEKFRAWAFHDSEGMETNPKLDAKASKSPAKQMLVDVDKVDARLPSIPLAQSYHKILLERYGKDSFESRFYMKYADSWYPKGWSKEQLEEELARQDNTWSRKMRDAFARSVSGE
jgi:hypothetical protein